MAMTEAQKRAQKKYREKNKAKQLYWESKSKAKKFLSIHASLKDVEEFKKMIEKREKLLNSIKWFNDNITNEIMNFDGTKNIIAITGQDLLTDDYLEAPEFIQADKSYIMDDNDFYEIGNREVENFVKDYPQISAEQKNEILDRLA